MGAQGSKTNRDEIPHPSLPVSYQAAKVYGLTIKAVSYTSAYSKGPLKLGAYVRKLVDGYKDALQLSPDRVSKLKKCTLSLAESAIEKVCKNLYNPSYLKCIAIASFIMVEEKLSDNNILEQLKDECDSTRIEQIVADMKKRQFEDKGCRIAA